jgi:hypothetical protein
VPTRSKSRALSARPDYPLVCAALALSFKELAV